MWYCKDTPGKEMELNTFRSWPKPSRYYLGKKFSKDIFSWYKKTFSVYTYKPKMHVKDKLSTLLFLCMLTSSNLVGQSNFPYISHIPFALTHINRQDIVIQTSTNS